MSGMLTMINFYVNSDEELLSVENGSSSSSFLLNKLHRLLFDDIDVG